MAALLKQQRGYVKGRITYFSNIISTKELTVHQITAIKEHIPELSQRFNNLQSQIEQMENNELQVNEREQFDNAFCELESLILSKLDGQEKPLPRLPSKVKCRLPEIELPTFDGKYSSWITFKEEFLSIVHENETLDDIDKFRYLVSALRNGTAFSIIEHLQRTNKNYQIAWKLVYDAFDNEALIKKKYMSDIYNINNVKENCSNSLQQFIDSFLKYYNALKALNLDVSSWDLFLVHHLSEKLDHQTRIQVEQNTPVDNLLTVAEFVDILRKRCRFMNAISCSRSNSSRPKQKSHTLVTAASLKCAACLQADHAIYQCKKFIDMPQTERYDLVKRRKLCINCLNMNHIWQKCNSKYNCQECGKRHHYLLHRYEKNSSEDSNVKPSCSGENNQKSDNTANESSPKSDCLSINYESESSPVLTTNAVYSNNTFENKLSMKKSKQILIATAVVWVYNNAGFRLPCRAVLDSASTAHFITENVCQKLGACKKGISTSFSGIGGFAAKSRYVVSLTIASRYSDYKAGLDFCVVPKITDDLPIRSFDFDKSKLPNNFELADPYFNEKEKIDLLIGAEVYHEIVTGERVYLDKQLPPFQKSHFGFIIAGNITDGVVEENDSSVDMKTVY